MSRNTTGSLGKRPLLLVLSFFFNEIHPSLIELTLGRWKLTQNWLLFFFSLSFPNLLLMLSWAWNRDIFYYLPYVFPHSYHQVGLADRLRVILYTKGEVYVPFNIWKSTVNLKFKFNQTFCIFICLIWEPEYYTSNSKSPRTTLNVILKTTEYHQFLYLPSKLHKNGINIVESFDMESLRKHFCFSEILSVTHFNPL